MWGFIGFLCPGLKGYVGVHGVLWGSTRNKSQMPPNEKVCVYEKLGLRSKHRVKVNLLIVEIVFLQKVWKKEDQCTSIFHFADRPELPHEVDFSRNRFARNIGFQKRCRFFCGGWLWVFSKRFWWFCKDFGLEPWRKMLLGGQLSLLSNQIN